MNNWDIEDLFVILWLLFFIGLIIFIIVLTAMGYQNEQTFDILVKDKYIKNGSKSGRYLVVDSDKNTYEITDLFFKGKFNSTDLYNELEIGQKYKVTTTGYRIRIFSHYQNINEIERIDE